MKMKREFIEEVEVEVEIKIKIGELVMEKERK